MPPPETFGRSFTMTPSTDTNFMNTPETKAGPLPFEQRPRETTKAYAAFKTYLDLGPTRSLVQAAAKLGCTKRRMEQLSRKNGWVARVDAFNQHFADLERQAIERLACDKAVEWWTLQEPTRRLAWLEAEEAIKMVRKARERWEQSNRTPGFEGMARMLELAIKLKQFATGMPSEIKEVHNLHAGKVSVEWEEAIRKAYDVTEPSTLAPAVVDVTEVQP